MNTIDDLLVAINNNGVYQFKRILRENSELVNAQNIDGETPLHHAAYMGNIEIMNILFENGADPNVKNNVEQTPLHYASISILSRKPPEPIKLLISHGVDVNAEDIYGRTPLHSACSSGSDIKNISILIENGANVNAEDEYGRTPLKFIDEVFDKYTSQSEMEIEKCRLLIEKGAVIHSFDNPVLRKYFNYKSEQFFDKYEPGTFCSICMDRLSDQTRPVCISLNCQHGFHCKCINKWLDSGKEECPYCRAPFDLITLNTDDQERLVTSGFGKRKVRRSKGSAMTLAQVNKLIRELKNM